jgi:hypothetical protein
VIFERRFAADTNVSPDEQPWLRLKSWQIYVVANTFDELTRLFQPR